MTTDEKIESIREFIADCEDALASPVYARVFPLDHGHLAADIAEGERQIATLELTR
jgi:hypothetical protein